MNFMLYLWSTETEYSNTHHHNPLPSQGEERMLMDVVIISNASWHLNLLPSKGEGEGEGDKEKKRCRVNPDIIDKNYYR